MGYRLEINGRGQALEGDLTTTGAKCLTSLARSDFSQHERGAIRQGDSTTPCPLCGQPGIIHEGDGLYKIMDIAVAYDGALVRCGCPRGTNRVIAPLEQWLGNGKSPTELAQEEQAAQLAAALAASEAAKKHDEEERDRNRIFAKSCLRGDGCNDAGTSSEPHTNFPVMAFFQAVPADDTVTDTEAPQRTQSAKKKQPTEDIPKPKERSTLYKWLFGSEKERDHQIASAVAASAARAQTATQGASILRPVAGRLAGVGGTWAVRIAGTATAGIGAPVAAFVVGMMPGRLNDGEQDFIDRMRAEQMKEAHTRVRYTWETDESGDLTPHGWHTPPGNDMVRVRNMEWDGFRQAYTFTTEEDEPVTIIWTPDSFGVNVPSDTGNQTPVYIPPTIIVDPLPDNTRIDATTSPAPEERNFADYILILPLPNIPPIYIYLSKPPVEFLEVELYSDFKRRSRQGKYEADHMPSAAAVRAALLRENPRLSKQLLDEMAQDVAAIVIPKDIHQKISETYGGRNTETQINLDSRNLRAAVDRNLDTIKPALKEHGATESQIEAARVKMHKLNSEMGLYKWP